MFRKKCPRDELSSKDGGILGNFITCRIKNVVMFRGEKLE